MWRRLAVGLGTLVAPTQASAQAPDWNDAYADVRAAAAACPDLPGGRRFANIQRDRDTVELLGLMLAADDAECVGGRAFATVTILRLLGPIDASTADPRLMALAQHAAERGLGMARDPALADRLARLLWLYGHAGPPADWPDADRNRWLLEPATIALLQARVARPERLFRTDFAVALLAGIKLYRDLPSFDPAGALDLLEDSALLIADAHRIRFSQLATGAAGLPPDFGRARRALIRHGTFGDQATPQLRAELLRIGTLAALNARTPAEMATALRILSPAALDGHAEEVAARDALIRRLGRIDTVPLAVADEARIAASMHREFAVRLGTRRAGDPETLAPIRVRALLAPDGRVAHAELLGGSGAAHRDRGILAAWAEQGDRADLSATARGRWAWVDLPPVDPELPIPR